MAESLEAGQPRSFDSGLPKGNQVKDTKAKVELFAWSLEADAECLKETGKLLDEILGETSEISKLAKTLKRFANDCESLCQKPSRPLNFAKK